MSTQAASPDISATVTASAGSGKTWLLVTRMIRLLLDGAEPGSILALTFTRKAAGEMKQRLSQQLYELAMATEQHLNQQISQFGLEPTDELRNIARSLYEKVQYAEFPVKCMTFHSFCQDILGQFAIEADVPPGFELIESTELIQHQAFQQLYNRATLQPESALAGLLSSLLEYCGTLENTRTALSSFLSYRNDWYSYTYGQAKPLDFACQHLLSQLGIEDNAEISYLNKHWREVIKDFAEQLSKVVTPTEIPRLEALQYALTLDEIDKVAYEQIKDAFYTSSPPRKPRSRKSSKKLEKVLADRADEFITTHYDICDYIASVDDLVAKQNTWQRTKAWYTTGVEYLAEFEQIKRQLRVLDFADLEWKTTVLLNHSDNAHWVQYKLDQRIDHFLIDEFQDTNPTQWQLLRPLLNELVSGEHEQKRSVFIVGDEKQSIYGFRRANPELQAHVASWLHQQIGADNYPLNKSWRSSPAIIDMVNATFLDDSQSLLHSFPKHDTHKTDLPGRVELQPIFEIPPEDETADNSPHSGLRNPLIDARVDDKGQQFHDEANWIASKIKQLISSGLQINTGDESRNLSYDDIYILLRKRTHVAYIEQALREHGIPFSAAKKGTLLDCLEIRDMETLLETLIAPFNDMAIAHILKSPVFAASDQDLLALSQLPSPVHWYQRLGVLAEQKEQYPAIYRAHVLLAQWRNLADNIPVHDLLDRIYSEGNILNRYHAATPAAYQNKVLANLQRFIELALDKDSGRYPSLSSFLYSLKTIRDRAESPPDEASDQQASQRVSIMTIHASKGLEAPVVFLADTATTPTSKDAYHALVNWDATEEQPDTLLLNSRKDQQDSFSLAVIDKASAFKQREDMHLLYVAMTRARQFLFISASQTGRASKNKPAAAADSWYSLIRNGLEKLINNDSSNELCYQAGELSYLKNIRPEHSVQVSDIVIDERLNQAVFSDEINLMQNEDISPSQLEPDSESPALARQDEITPDDDFKTRGIVIHRALELLTGKTVTEQQLKPQLMAEFIQQQQADIENWINEAQTVVQHDKFSYLFSVAEYENAYNEIPIQFRQGGKNIYGIIDRLVIYKDKIYIIDYKTSAQANDKNITLYMDKYRAQMSLYQSGIELAWPDREVIPVLLFTTPLLDKVLQ